MSKIEEAIAKIQSVGSQICSNQVYVFHDYDPVECDPTDVCARLKIPFSDDVILYYPAERTFAPLDPHRIDAEEKTLGVALPSDYKTLLQVFGEFHLPGDESVCIEAPLDAERTTRGQWQLDDELTALAISSFNDTADGDSIGFLRQGNAFGPEVYHFNHELRYHGDDPHLWTKKIADSLADFIIDYLARKR